MPATFIGWGHLALALAAMAVGGAVALEPKGTGRHLWLGRCYGILMLGVNVTAFLLYGLFGRFGPFHVAALFSLATLVAGWVPMRGRRTPLRVGRHAYWMGGSYVGLLAAATAETLGRLPGTPFWPMVIGASIGVSVLGAAVMRARVPAALRRHKPVETTS